MDRKRDNELKNRRRWRRPRENPVLALSIASAAMSMVAPIRVVRGIMCATSRKQRTCKKKELQPALPQNFAWQKTQAATTPLTKNRSMHDQRKMTVPGMDWLQISFRQWSRDNRPDSNEPRVQAFDSDARRSR